MSDFNHSYADRSPASAAPEHDAPDLAVDAAESSAAPFSKNGEDDGSLVCGRCSTVNPAGAATCSQCRSFLLANQVARRHGIYARTQPANLRMTADELMAGTLSDQGGESEVSTLQRSYIRKLGDLEITIRLLTSDIATNGLLTPGGRVRDVYDKLLTGLSVFDKYAMRIGLARKAKRVPSLSEVLAAAEEQR